MGRELLSVFCLVDKKGVIHIPKPHPGSCERCLRL